MRPALLILSLVAGCAGPAPAPIADEAFWQLAMALSEPPREFAQPDNLVSNEPLFAEFTRLIRRRGGAYIGVGPEQNFSYIARLEPTIAFVVDIRQDNRNLHLLYKALFEIADDRAAFLSLLFSRQRPDVSRAASVDDLFEALANASASAQQLERTRNAIRDRLTHERRFPLAEQDIASMDVALQAFFLDGPAIRYGRSTPAERTWPSYRALMTKRDLWGNAQSYLANEEVFSAVKRLHAANRIVPVVGDFAGAHTLRRIGEHLRSQSETVSAFYGSNVEVYLTRTERRTFCANLATLPYDDGTQFIGNRRLLTMPVKLQACAHIQPSLPFPDLGASH
jgi:hypothetical protein